MPKDDDKCGRILEDGKECGHSFFYHATDLSHDKMKCWHGCVTGHTCECPEFKPKEGK